MSRPQFDPGQQPEGMPPVTPCRRGRRPLNARPMTRLSIRKTKHDHLAVQTTDMRGVNVDCPCLVGSAVCCMSGGQTFGGNSRLCDIHENILTILESIYKKHGDIAQNCWLKSDSMKSSVLTRICEMVQDLRTKQIKDLASSGSLDSYYTAVMDAEKMGMNVLWLHKRLDEIKDAFNLAVNVESLEDEKHRLLEHIKTKKQAMSLLNDEMKKLQSKCQDLVDSAVQDVVKVEELDKKINARSLKRTQFLNANFMDGLI